MTLNHWVIASNPIWETNVNQALTISFVGAFLVHEPSRSCPHELNEPWSPLSYDGYNY